MGKKVLIVGGVAGGASTAARLRRQGEDYEIIMFERGDYISYANCGLPYYIGGSIAQRKKLLVQTPEAMKARFNIDVRVQQEVIDIDREAKKVTVANKITGESYEESYDTLVLSPGSSPLKPPIPGIENENIFTLWTVPDVDKIKEYVETNEIKKATVVGAGFIGIEVAENLHDLGVEVTIAEMLDQVMAPFDQDMARILHKHLRDKGINLQLGNGVKEFVHENGTKVILQDGTEVESDMVMLSIGVRANSELAIKAGLEVNERKGIVVDAFMKTNDPSIYALGDAVEVTEYVAGEKTMIPLAGPANKQGRIVADNIHGRLSIYKGTQGSSIVKFFDLTAASTGLSEKTLQKMGKVYNRDYKVAISISGSNAGYYPGATSMFQKLIFDNEGTILGAQIIGDTGVDKRIDVIGMAIRFRGAVDDLMEFEQAYAPPYNSAKDPVNMIGFIADNILAGKMPVIRPEEIKEVDFEKSILLDVRTTKEHEKGHIENSLLIPVDELRDRISELDKTKEIVIYCAAGLRGYIASNMLRDAGFATRNLIGGFNFYNM